jgi:chromosome segregation ATPase
MFQRKLELEQERCGKLESELRREQQRIEREKDVIQKLKKELLTLEGQRDSLNTQVTRIALVKLEIIFV